MDNLEMDHAGVSSYAGNTNNVEVETVPESAPQFAGVNRISEHLQGLATEITPEMKQELEQEITRQYLQLEPVYKLVHRLLKNISKAIIEGIEDNEPMEFGFAATEVKSINIRSVQNYVEATAKLLNIHYEGMQGIASKLTMELRQSSLNVQTQLEHYALKFRAYTGDGELDRSNKSAYMDDLLELQMLLGKEEQHLEILRQHVG